MGLQQGARPPGARGRQQALGGALVLPHSTPATLSAERLCLFCHPWAGTAARAEELRTRFGAALRGSAGAAAALCKQSVRQVHSLGTPASPYMNQSHSSGYKLALRNDWTMPSRCSRAARSSCAFASGRRTGMADLGMPSARASCRAGRRRVAQHQAPAQGQSTHGPLAVTLPIPAPSGCIWPATAAAPPGQAPRPVTCAAGPDSCERGAEAWQSSRLIHWGARSRPDAPRAARRATEGRAAAPVAQRLLQRACQGGGTANQTVAVTALPLHVCASVDKVIGSHATNSPWSGRSMRAGKSTLKPDRPRLLCRRAACVGRGILLRGSAGLRHLSLRAPHVLVSQPVRRLQTECSDWRAARQAGAALCAGRCPA